MTEHIGDTRLDEYGIRVSLPHSIDYATLSPAQARDLARRLRAHADAADALAAPTAGAEAPPEA